MLRKLILFSASLLLAIPASAALVLFSVNPSTIQTPPGGISDPTCQNDVTKECVIFSGTISFTADQDYFLYDIAINIPTGGSVVIGNDDYFQFNSPGVLGADNQLPPYQCGSNSCFVGGLFEIDVSSTAASGLYSGTATLQAIDEMGAPVVGFDIVQPFIVDVVPEPGVSTLMLFGLVSLAAAGRRYRGR